MVCIGGPVAGPLIIANLICVMDGAVKVSFIGTTLIMTGMATLMQTLIGTRLPLIQGPSFTFLPPIIAMTQVIQ